jgi:dihydrofolate synthase / folylpolyglutamate synthase
MAFSSLDEWLCWIEQQHPKEIDMGLERVAAVAETLGIQFEVPVFTVAGTNGKGSCVALLTSILTAAGLRCGSYTSPHLLRYNERVCLDGKLVSDAALCRAFTAIEKARGDIPLTYFEYGTLAALLIFQQADLDVVILEVGLGGRLDAVNIVDPDVAIISSVDIDHQQWLGNTREQIGREKAGIFRSHRPGIMGDPASLMSVTDSADQCGAVLLQRDRDFGYEASGEYWHWWGNSREGERLEYRDLITPTLMLDNAASVLQALMSSPLTIDLSAIQRGLEAVTLAGRGESYDYCQRTLRLNVAHNPAALTAMLATLPKRSGQQKRWAIFSVLADKAVEEMIAMCMADLDHWQVLQLHSTPRAMDAEAICVAIEGLGGHCSTFDSAEQCLADAVAKTNSGDEILVFGSFFTVAEILGVLETKKLLGD